MTGKTVLIVDDEQAIRELLALYLTKEGFVVQEAADGAEALIKNQEYKPDIIILDIMMPVLDGMEVCRQIRKFSNIPIIMLTSRAEDEDRILGLEIGADDYVTKPFNSREVVARVKAVLRRLDAPRQQPEAAINYPELLIDMAEHTVKAYGREVSLANKEMELLWHLASHPGRAFSREQLLESVWGYSYCGDTRTVDTHIKRIRKKLAIGTATPWDIKTVWGIGYKFEVKK
ncbi:response regulator transcription factor [Sporomusa acidovorans]|uniref:Transcriptional regulatory protein SrrA n=1 Tax=Sporomusa acidovorans (strain ATCC 49682 / DSM 3132 / Mol) TaxID=1123286 RepID=A0ABZ3IXQ7_SPOA4|nr:response regulator transcription factor [Sporomusa acidovorans]OZC22211.1 transcriptional regulatory protein SrrA [Sporomusa acidovorans DSM 3132]SDE81512.1 DNA-binding response regulator, OmpR family, contains REC and winged-helix (wHTH) domain [Sporomusa acidovorans]